MINYVVGDTTKPIGGGNKLIINIVNDVGKWVSDFVLAISKRWKLPEEAYRDWHRELEYANCNDYCSHIYGEDTYEVTQFVLGQIQPVKVSSDITVINMIAQRSVGMLSLHKPNGLFVKIPPIRYYALEECLYRVFNVASRLGASVHGPRIGAKRSDGDWKKIESIIEKTLCDNGISVTIYDFE